MREGQPGGAVDGEAVGLAAAAGRHRERRRKMPEAGWWSPGECARAEKELTGNR